MTGPLNTMAKKLSADENQTNKGNSFDYKGYNFGGAISAPSADQMKENLMVPSIDIPRLFKTGTERMNKVQRGEV